MRGSDFAELKALSCIAEHGSFARAAAHLRVSPSALSQTIRALEERLGVRLLNRTTRSVAPSEAGARLLARLTPALREIDAAVADVGDFRDRPAGTLRIDAARTAAVHVVAPLLGRFHEAYPDVVVELSANDAITDIVSGRFDAGIRLGERLDKDMVAVRLTRDYTTLVVASPAYLARRGAPKSPRDLLKHDCINSRLPTNGNLYRWEFERGSKALEIAVSGPLVVNDWELSFSAALDGVGVAYLFGERVERAVERGELVRLLDAWSPSFPGFYLYYPSRKKPPPALKAFVDFARANAPPLGRPGGLAQALSEAMSMTKRYLTSLFRRRSYASLIC